MTICAVCQSGSSVSFGIAFPHLYYPLSYALPEARTPAGLYFSVSAAPFPLLHKYLLSWIECKNTSKKKKKIVERASREWNSDSCSIDNFDWISYLNTCSIQANKTIRFFKTQLLVVCLSWLAVLSKRWNKLWCVGKIKVQCAKQCQFGNTFLLLVHIRQLLKDYCWYAPNKYEVVKNFIVSIELVLKVTSIINDNNTFTVSIQFRIICVFFIYDNDFQWDYIYTYV